MGPQKEALEEVTNNIRISISMGPQKDDLPQK